MWSGAGLVKRAKWEGNATEHYEKITLPNGVRIVAEPMPWLRSASAGIWVGVGSRAESARENGSAHFIEHMVFKGTKTRTSEQLSRELDAIGSQSDAFTAKEHTCFHGRALDTHLDKLLDVLCDIFFDPLFDPGDIETERRVIHEEIDMYADAPDDVAAERLLAAMYRGNALARPILGTKRSLAGLDRDALLAFRDKNYIGGETVVSLCGSFSRRQIDTLCARFAALPAGKAKPYTTPRAKPAVTVRRKRTEQNHLCLAFPATPLGHPDNYALRLLATALGGGMASRLFLSLRERRGLCYSVYAFADQFRDCGHFCIETSLGDGAERDALGVILDELRRVCDDGLTAGELERTREQTKASLLMAQESTSARMQRLALDELTYGRAISPDELLAGYDAVTLDSVQALARRLFDLEKCAFSAVGRTLPADVYARILRG